MYIKNKKDISLMEEFNHFEESMEEYKELNTGIAAIDSTYFFDKRAELLVDIFNKAIEYVKKHTNLTEEQIKVRINNCIRQIEFKEEYPDNPNGVGYVDTMLFILSMNVNVLEKSPQYIYEFIRHEIMHMVGSKIVKPSFKRSLIISGYSRENAFELKKKKENEYFNESAVEMFVAQDEEYRQEKVLDYTINTNQDLNSGIYCLNSNLIHQMLIAKGIDDQEFFEGLYDYKKSKQVIRKFKRSIFKKLSSNMDNIYEEINEYYDIDDEIYAIKQEDELTDVSEQLGKMDKHKSNLESIISQSERMIIDKILLPRLKKLSSIAQQQLLEQYDKFIISEREYFQSRTNYRVVTVKTKSSHPWFKHIDVKSLQRNRNSDIISPTKKQDIDK